MGGGGSPTEDGVQHLFISLSLKIIQVYNT